MAGIPSLVGIWLPKDAQREREREREKRDREKKTSDFVALGILFSCIMTGSRKVLNLK